MEWIIYLLKSSFILSGFWLIYLLFFRKETFFGPIRYYFLLGMVSSIILPLIYISPQSGNVLTVVTEQLSAVYLNEQMAVYSDTSSMGFLNLFSILLLIYFGGLLWFASKLIYAFYKLLVFTKKTGHSHYFNGFRHLQVKEKVSPFSFFKTIVYNPDLHSPNDLDHILKHEYVHIQKFHSLDLILANVFCVFQWFNPLAWMFKKSLNQNLEFMADDEASKTAINLKEYQYCLLKNSVAGGLPFPVNQFYQPFLKTRIMMLQKAKSKSANVLKLALILPFLFIFFMSCQSESTDIQEQEKTMPTLEEIKKNIPTTEVQTVPFSMADQAPIYPGCEDSNNNEERKTCLNAKIQTFMGENFKTEIVKQDPLINGLQRINAQFTIGVDGKIEDILAKSQFEVLAIEAERVLQMMPQMTEPAKLNGQPVKVIYQLPIVFQID